MGQLAGVSRAGEIAVITIDNPPVNALGAPLIYALDTAFRELEDDPQVRAIVLIGAGRGFIAGADIREFQSAIESGGSGDPGLNPVLNRIENCAKPVVAAIHGSALGGGLETAMACHYRVAAPQAQVGQPEVKLGLIPGAGGTQRLPRLAGIAAALAMCTSGAPRSAAEALSLGIIDEIIEGDLLAGAVAYAAARIGEGPRPTRLRDEKLASADPSLFQSARRNASRNMIAPLMAIDAIEAATRLPFEQGLAYEADLFRRALFSEQAKALIYAFFGEREVARIPFAKDAPVLPVRTAAVIGAGTMGSGIAMALANAGIPVLLREADQSALDRGMNTIRRNYAGAVSKGRMKQEDAERRIALISPVLSYERFGEADLIIEAVFENLEVKKAIFAELDAVARPDAILATNTSTLDIDEVAAATSRPANVIGMHFFSPANIMRMLEVVRGRATSDTTLMTVMAAGKRLGKIAVLAGNCAGFIANRMYFACQREAERLVELGAAPESVDSALYEFGMAMGPLATDDLIGLDVCRDIRAELARRGTLAAGTSIEDRLLEAGRRGQKSGAGWYRYDQNRRAQPDPEITPVIEDHRRALGIAARDFTQEEIVERVLFPMMDEGARILEEGHALRPVDIDMVFIHGFGFPAWRGGPMFHADAVGLQHVRDRLLSFAHKPAKLLDQLASANGTFANWSRERSGTAA